MNEINKEELKEEIKSELKEEFIHMRYRKMKKVAYALVIAVIFYTLGFAMGACGHEHNHFNDEGFQYSQSFSQNFPQPHIAQPYQINPTPTIIQGDPSFLGQIK